MIAVPCVSTQILETYKQKRVLPFSKGFPEFRAARRRWISSLSDLGGAAGVRQARGYDARR